jgi:hypothetical protein
MGNVTQNGEENIENAGGAEEKLQFPRLRVPKKIKHQTSNFNWEDAC